MTTVASTTAAVLDELDISDPGMREVYMADIVNFFELLFMPGGKQTV